MHTEAQLKGSQIVIIDDEPSNVAFLEQLLSWERYEKVRGFTDPVEGLSFCRLNKVDLVLLDLRMPKLDGYEALKELRSGIHEADFIPILVFTADVDPAAKKKALALGANDFLTKPCDATEIALRVDNFLRMRHLHQGLRQHNEALESKVTERTADLEASRMDVIVRLAKAAEFRDDDTGEHTRRVGAICAQIAAALPECHLDPHELELAAILHDVGKIGIPDSILLKPGKLTPDEFDMMKSHTEIGNLILRDSPSPILRLAARIAITHHERWDGSGYPYGLAGKDIPVEGRIVAVADVFDALTHERPYKKAWPIAEALEEIRRSSGSHFDPEVVDCFLGLDCCHLSLAA